MAIVQFLLWMHFLGLATAMGGGIALSQTAPRLVIATPHQLPLVWKLERTFSFLVGAGVAVLVTTGPLMAWLKYGGFESMPGWFWIRMVLVAVAVLAVAAHELAARRFRRGDAGAHRWMGITGSTAGISMVLVVLCAVLAFN